MLPLRGQGGAWGGSLLPVRRPAPQEEQPTERIGEGESFPTLPDQQPLERGAGKLTGMDKIDIKGYHSALIARPTACANCEPSIDLPAGRSCCAPFNIDRGSNRVGASRCFHRASSPRNSSCN